MNLKMRYLFPVCLFNFCTIQICSAQVVKVVNMVPLGYSAEEHQGSEPWLTVDRLNTNLIIASAFGDADGPNTLDPKSPLYVSQNNGLTWSLEFILLAECTSKGNVSDITLVSGMEKW